MAIEGRDEQAFAGRIRLGMVGGGEGAFIGAVHRLAARMDDQYELVAGALSAARARAKRSALALGIEKARAYGDFETMAQSRGGAAGRHRGGRDRDAQSHARAGWRAPSLMPVSM